MTKEEFYRYANERPEPPEPSIYNIQIFYYCDDEEGYTLNAETGQWEYKIYTDLWRTYTTKDKALTALHDYLKKKHYPGHKVHSAMIWREAVDVFVSKDIDGNLGMWLFDANGNLIDKTVCDGFHMSDYDVPYGVYFGRTDSDIHFKKGDILKKETSLRYIQPTQEWSFWE